MKKIGMITILGLLVMSVTGDFSFADSGKRKITVDCATPEMMAANELATVKGTLSLKRQTNGQYLATGTLEVNVTYQLPSQASPRSITTKVRGVYDELTEIIYAHVGPTEKISDLNTIYMNFNDTETESKSYIEYRTGNPNILNCGKK